MPQRRLLGALGYSLGRPGRKVMGRPPLQGGAPCDLQPTHLRLSCKVGDVSYGCSTRQAAYELARWQAIPGLGNGAGLRRRTGRLGGRGSRQPRPRKGRTAGRACRGTWRPDPAACRAGCGRRPDNPRRSRAAAAPRAQPHPRPEDRGRAGTSAQRRRNRNRAHRYRRARRRRRPAAPCPPRTSAIKGRRRLSLASIPRRACAPAAGAPSWRTPACARW